MVKKDFCYKTYAWKNTIDYRLNPEQYKIGKGEQGVLLCNPYKEEILLFWHFKTPTIAIESSEKIYKLFLNYLEKDDFIGADMARKFLQMGFTRARRYTNYKSGRKYDPKTGENLEKGTGDPIKAESAAIFFKKWKIAENHPEYKAKKILWKNKFG